jgi:hypothetical protein
MRTLLRNALLAGLALSHGALAAPTPPGSYVYEHGSGTLEIKAGAAGLQHFTIETVGGNGHSCAVEGDLRDGHATIESSLDDKACELTFAVKGRTIDLTTNGADSCREWCGMRAAFDGQYQLPTPACVDATRQASRKRFKKLFDAKDYAAAEQVLPPILAECEAVVGEIERRWILNDLALTQWKLGRPRDCLATLKPLSEEAARTDDELQEDYPPADYDSFLPVIKATRANLRLCAKQ